MKLLKTNVPLTLLVNCFVFLLLWYHFYLHLCFHLLIFIVPCSVILCLILLTDFDPTLNFKQLFSQFFCKLEAKSFFSPRIYPSLFFSVNLRRLQKKVAFFSEDYKKFPYIFEDYKKCRFWAQDYKKSRFSSSRLQKKITKNHQFLTLTGYNSVNTTLIIFLFKPEYSSINAL